MIKREPDKRGGSVWDMATVMHEARSQIENTDTKETALRAGCFFLLVANINALQSLILRSAK